MNRGQVLYARGFCIVPDGREGIPGWFRSTLVMGWRIGVDERTPLTRVTASDGSFVVLIGYAIDIATAHDDAQRLATTLLRALSVSERAFFERLDGVGGRYAIFYGDQSGASIVGDACATRTIYYSRDEPFLASHFEMIAAACGGSRSEHWEMRRRDKKRHSTFGYPAGETPNRNIGLLLANMVLRLGSLRYERFYPRNELGPLRVDEAADRLSSLFRVQLKVLADRYRIVCSLTAGLDSRTTLAVLRPFLGRTIFFSYATQPKEEVDAAMAQEIARKYSLEHHLLPRYDRESEEFLKFKNSLIKNSYHSHNREAAYGYQFLFGQGDIHIRSNLYEIGRSFYRGIRHRPADLTSEAMARLFYKDWTTDDQDLTAAFDRYIGASNFEHGRFGYDPYDLYYWEQRMSCWHALVLLEADPSVDTYLLMNSRWCLEAALAVPTEDRIKATVFRELIQIHWPELLDWAINPKELGKVLTGPRKVG